MRIKNGFVLREVAGQYVVIATGEASKDFYGMIRLNDTGKEIWQSLQEGLSEIEIATCIQEKYDVAYEEALEDTRNFVEKIREAGFLMNEK